MCPGVRWRSSTTRAGCSPRGGTDSDSRRPRLCRAAKPTRGSPNRLETRGAYTATGRRSAAAVTLARDERTPVEYREALAITGGEARRLGRLVDDMLVLARADARGYPLRPETLYLNELVVECQRAVEVLARQRGVTVETS